MLLGTCFLPLCAPAFWLTTLWQADAGDVASPLALLLAGVIVGGIISATRTRTADRASK